MKTLVVLFLIAVSPGIVFDQSSPVPGGPQTLAGVWLLERVKSDFHAPTDAYKDQSIEIMVNGSELKLILTYVEKSKSVRSERVLYSDNRGEVNKISFGQTEIDQKSKTKWKGSKLICEVSETKTKDGSIFAQTQKYEISKDGLHLIQSVENSLPFAPTGRTSTVFIYKRKP